MFPRHNDGHIPWADECSSRLASDVAYNCYLENEVPSKLSPSSEVPSSSSSRNIPYLEISKIS